MLVVLVVAERVKVAVALAVQEQVGKEIKAVMEMMAVVTTAEVAAGLEVLVAMQAPTQEMVVAVRLLALLAHL